jgi:hypothetical protein
VDHGSTELKGRKPTDATQCFKSEEAIQLENCQFSKDQQVSDLMTSYSGMDYVADIPEYGTERSLHL